MSEKQSLVLPIGEGQFVQIVVGITEEDFKLILDTLELWKKRIVKKRESTPDYQI